MKKSLTFLLALLAHVTSLSQWTVSGKVLSEVKTPLDYALIAISPLSDSTRILSTISDSVGGFQFILPSDIYQLSIQMLGYQTFYTTIDVTAHVDIGPVILTLESTLLASVEVIAEHSVVAHHLGKKVLWIGQDLASTGSNVLDALEQIPSISTSPRGEVQIRGNSNVIVYVNGKETQRDPSTLKFISADVLKKIEVITNPPAEYDAEGVGGIINLVYKKYQWTQLKIEAVFNGTVLTDPIFVNPNGAFNLSWNKNKSSAFCNVSYDFDQYVSRSESSRLHFANPLQLYENQLEYDGEGGTTGINLGFTFEPDSSLSLGLEANYHKWDFNEATTQTTRFHYTDAPTQSFVIPNSVLEIEDELWLNFSLEKKIDRDKILKLSLTKGGEIEENEWRGDMIDGASTSAIIDQFLLSSVETESQSYYQGKVDLLFPFFNFGKWKTGIKWDLIDYNILQKIRLRSDVISLPDNDFQMNMNKVGAYLLQSQTLGHLEYEVGLRTEQFSSTAIQQSNQQTFAQDYFQWFPSIQLNYLLDEREHSIGINITRRISRPGFFDLNPYVSYQDPLNIRTGSPSLRPEIGTLYELNYHRELSQWTVDLSIFRRTTIDAIQSQIIPTESERTITKPTNIGKLINNGIEVQLENRWTKNIKTSLDLVAGQSSFEDDEVEISYNHKWAWRMRMRQQFLLDNDWKIQGSVSYRAPSFRIQERRVENFTMDLAISKTLNQKRGSVSISIRDIFNTKVYQYKLAVADFELDRKTKWQTRQITLGVRYNIIDKKM